MQIETLEVHKTLRLASDDPFTLALARAHKRAKAKERRAELAADRQRLALLRKDGNDGR